jgi:OmpA-OmpF porin, OOP family
VTTARGNQVGLWGALLLATVAATAQAQPADIETLRLDPSARGSLLLGNGSTLPGLRFRTSVNALYSYGHLRTVGTSQVLVRDRFGFEINGALGVTNWLEINASVPIIVAQTTTIGFNANPAGLGTPYLGVRFGILDHTAPFALNAGIDIGLPLGTRSALGNSGWQFHPKVNLGQKFQHLQLGVELGAQIREFVSDVTREGGPRLGHAVTVAAMVSGVGKGLRGEFSTRLYFPLSGQKFGVEGLFGMRYPVGEGEFFVALGPGLLGESVTPNFRLYLGAAYDTAGPPRPPCEEGKPYVITDCPDLDRDDDGVKNGKDGAPEDPEDKDSFEDTDGIPDPDNDKDGVLDGDDACPLVRGPRENKGCPDDDRDGDKLVDRLDKCPDQAEDYDGYQDEDGCPETDNDGDGFADPSDECPNVPGIKEEKGCPGKDDDNDAVLNHLDNCVKEPGPPENQGCPVAQKQLVVITRENLKILDKVYFALNKATILPKSFPLLDQIAAVLNQQQRVKLLQIEGHTDNTGKPDYNLKLSGERASSIRDYLIKKGVDGKRLVGKGFGQDKPAQPNDTPAGRDANRRVEFNILEQD